MVGEPTGRVQARLDKDFANQQSRLWILVLDVKQILDSRFKIRNKSQSYDA